MVYSCLPHTPQHTHTHTHVHIRTLLFSLKTSARSSWSSGISGHSAARRWLLSNYRVRVAQDARRGHAASVCTCVCACARVSAYVDIHVKASVCGIACLLARPADNSLTRLFARQTWLPFDPLLLRSLLAVSMYLYSRMCVCVCACVHVVALSGKVVTFSATHARHAEIFIKLTAGTPMKALRCPAASLRNHNCA